MPEQGAERIHFNAWSALPGIPGTVDLPIRIHDSKHIQVLSMADEFKKQGNEAFAKKDYQAAVDFFSQAIEADPENHVLYSNRSASYASLQKYDLAYDDAVRTTEIKSDWGKGWSRKGAAAHGLGFLDEAKESYEQALKAEPTNVQAKNGLAAVEDTIQRKAGSEDAGLGGMFKDPQLFSKLAQNEKTKHLLADSAFMQKLQRLQSDPSSAQDALQDPRMMQVLGVMLGIDMQTMAPGEDIPMPDAKPSTSSASAASQETKSPEQPSSSRPEAKETPASKPEPEPMDVEKNEKRTAKEEADKLKALGNTAYKSRDFDMAIQHYTAAWEKFQDITYLNNLAAAYYEKGDLDGCLRECEKAIQEGQERVVDFKVRAKTFSRMANAYQKQADYTKAIGFYQRSLTEHRDSEVLKKLRAAEKAKTDADRQAYLDPGKAEDAREEGNRLFKAADWPGAVKAYTEMIKRNPSDVRGYSNRAAAYIKLLSMPEAVKDCDKAIEIDPSFVRAYIRKANALFAMHEYNKAIEVCRKAHEADTAHKSTNEIDAQMQRCMQAMYSSQEGETEEQTMERISRDPEIVSILQDPVMQSILQQAKENPAALQDHMKNSTVREKVQKLMAAGIIRVGR